MPAASPRCTGGWSRCSNGTTFRRHSTAGRTRFRGAVPFAEDNVRRDYDRNSAERFREALAAMLPVVRAISRWLQRARRARSTSGGAHSTSRSAASPAARRRSIQAASPGFPDRITREAYSDEVSSAGFWAGGVTAAEPFFYSYVYPEADGFRSASGDARQVRRDLRRVRSPLCRRASIGSIRNEC